MAERLAHNEGIVVRFRYALPAVVGQRSDRRLAKADVGSSNLPYCTSLSHWNGTQRLVNAVAWVRIPDEAPASLALGRAAAF